MNAARAPDAGEPLFERLVAVVGAALPGAPPLPPDRLGVVEGEALVPLARAHSVLPLFLEGLQRTGADLRSEWFGQLRHTVIGQSLWTLALRVELARLARLLEQERIPFVVLKGVAVREAYGARGLRPSVDNDILVRPEDFPAFERLLLGEGGYSPEPLADWKKRAHLRVHGQYTFRRMQAGIRLSVDVHTRVMPLGYRYAEDVGDLIGRGRAADVEGGGVPVPSWEDLLVVLCANGLKDQWSRLRLVADLVAVSGRIADWEAVDALAVRTDSYAQVAVGLALASDLFRVPVPAPFTPLDPGVARLARALADRLRQSKGGWDEWGRVRLFLGAQDGLGAKFRYAAFTALRRLSEPLIRAD